MKVGEFIGLLFLSRDYAHVTHLNTRNYAEHVALGSFYTDIIPLADGFAEAYQGCHGLIGAIPLQNAKKSAKAAEMLQDHLDEIQKGRYEFCPKEETALQNLIDGICEKYLSTIYKLRFLS
jgi:hypothetical protein